MRSFFRPIPFAVTILTAGILGLHSDIFAQGKVVSLLKGELLTGGADKAAGVNIAVFKGHDKVITTKSTPEGKFQGVLPGAGIYRITIKSDKYFYVEDTIDISSLEAYKETPYRRQLLPLVSGSSLPLEQKVFAFGSSDIEDGAVSELTNWALAARQNPQLSYEITVFPDQDIMNIKKDAAQVKLAKMRAQEIQSFFIGKDVSVNVSTSSNHSSLPARFEESVKISKKKSQTRTEPQKILITTRVR